MFWTIVGKSHSRITLATIWLKMLSHMYFYVCRSNDRVCWILESKCKHNFLAFLNNLHYLCPICSHTFPMQSKMCRLIEWFATKIKDILVQQGRKRIVGPQGTVRHVLKSKFHRASSWWKVGNPTNEANNFDYKGPRLKTSTNITTINSTNRAVIWSSGLNCLLQFL